MQSGRPGCPVEAPAFMRGNNRGSIDRALARGSPALKRIIKVRTLSPA